MPDNDLYELAEIIIKKCAEIAKQEYNEGDSPIKVRINQYILTEFGL